MVGYKEKRHQASNNKQSTRSFTQPSPSSASYLRDNRDTAVMQLKSTVQNSGQMYDFGGGRKQMVGQEMRAWLDPAQPLRGQSANINTSQNDMMSAIRNRYGLKGGQVVKGHLLNDNLGGTALSNNLFPITKAANGAHLGYVENLAKEDLWSKGMGVFYQVRVRGHANIKSPKSAFECKLQQWNPSSNKVVGGALTLSVNSDFGNAVARTAYHDVDAMDVDDDYEFGRVKNPHKPQGFMEPAKKVGSLNSLEAKARNFDNNNKLSSFTSFNS